MNKSSRNTSHRGNPPSRSGKDGAAFELLRSIRLKMRQDTFDPRLPACGRPFRARSAQRAFPTYIPREKRSYLVSPLWRRNSCGGLFGRLNSRLFLLLLFIAPRARCGFVRRHLSPWNKETPRPAAPLPQKILVFRKETLPSVDTGQRPI